MLRDSEPQPCRPTVLRLPGGSASWRWQQSVRCAGFFPDTPAEWLREHHGFGQADVPSAADAPFLHSGKGQLLKPRLSPFRPFPVGWHSSLRRSEASPGWYFVR